MMAEALRFRPDAAACSAGFRAFEDGTGKTLFVYQPAELSPTTLYVDNTAGGPWALHRRAAFEAKVVIRLPVLTLRTMIVRPFRSATFSPLTAIADAYPPCGTLPRLPFTTRPTDGAGSSKSPEVASRSSAVS